MLVVPHLGNQTLFHVISAATVQHTTAVHMMPDRMYANAQIYGVPYNVHRELHL